MASVEKEMADEDNFYMEEYAKLEPELDKATKSMGGVTGEIQLEYGTLAELIDKNTEARAEVE